MMARRVQPEWRGPSVGILAIAAVLAIGSLGAFALLARPLSGGGANAEATPGASAPAVANLPTSSPTSSREPEPSARPSAPPTEGPDASATPRATARPSPARTATVRRPVAPTNPAGFDLTGQVIDIAFPIRPEVTYQYRDNWLDRRAGVADPYNHARVADDGRMLRLHDGIDIYGPEGAPVVAPFAGRVIDPRSRWTPWEPDRYGLTVVIESTEPETAGYTAMLVHLDHVWVEVGQRVQRGQVLGVLGRTGNAEDVRPQLHFELRAPFLIDWSPIGYDRRVDAFNPYPSLVEADPHL